MERHFVTLQSRGLIALPAGIRARHGLDEPGAQVEVIERDDGVIELHPQVAVPADQAWFWTSRWQEMEREVDEHVSRGQVSVHESNEAFLTHLSSLDATE